MLSIGNSANINNSQDAPNYLMGGQNMYGMNPGLAPNQYPPMHQLYAHSFAADMYPMNSYTGMPFVPPDQQSMTQIYSNFS